MAMPAPIPRPAPVTMATCSSRRKSLICIMQPPCHDRPLPRATNERDLAAALLPAMSQAATLGYGEHRELRTLVQPYAAHRFQVRPLALGDERQPALDHPRTAGRPSEARCAASSRHASNTQIVSRSSRSWLTTYSSQPSAPCDSLVTAMSRSTSSPPHPGWATSLPTMPNRAITLAFADASHPWP